MPPPTATHGLALFLAVYAADTALLALDAWLYATGGTPATISRRVWDDPRLGVPLVAFQLLAPLGLVLHFYGI